MPWSETLPQFSLAGTLLTVLLLFFAAFGEPYLGRRAFAWLSRRRDTDAKALVRVHSVTMGVHALWGVLVMVVLFTSPQVTAADLGLRLPHAVGPVVGGALGGLIALGVLWVMVNGLPAQIKDRLPKRALDRPKKGKRGGGRRAAADRPVSLPEPERDRWLLIPYTRNERSAAIGVAVTGGLCAELLYRGLFIVLVTSMGVPLWVGAVLSVLLFAVAYLYQGWWGLVSAGASGTLFVVLYLGTGSLWIPVLVHIALNLRSLAFPPAALREESYAYDEPYDDEPYDDPDSGSDETPDGAGHPAAPALGAAQPFAPAQDTLALGGAGYPGGAGAPVPGGPSPSRDDARTALPAGDIGPYPAAPTWGAPAQGAPALGGAERPPTDENPSVRGPGAQPSGSWNAPAPEAPGLGGGEYRPGAHGAHGSSGNAPLPGWGAAGQDAPSFADGSSSGEGSWAGGTGAHASPGTWNAPAPGAPGLGGGEYRPGAHRSPVDVPRSDGDGGVGPAAPGWGTPGQGTPSFGGGSSSGEGSWAGGTGAHASPGTWNAPAPGAPGLGGGEYRPGAHGADASSWNSGVQSGPQPSAGSWNAPAPGAPGLGGGEHRPGAHGADGPSGSAPLPERGTPVQGTPSFGGVGYPDGPGYGTRPSAHGDPSGRPFGAQADPAPRGDASRTSGPYPAAPAWGTPAQGAPSFDGSSPADAATWGAGTWNGPRPDAGSRNTPARGGPAPGGAEDRAGTPSWDETGTGSHGGPRHAEPRWGTPARGGPVPGGEGARGRDPGDFLGGDAPAEEEGRRLYPDERIDRRYGDR
ncbi:CPBP family glutamic-type intramembrane protease [Nocardiopsis sp. N85]|uniref:CPBP family glutamic-type intramembrane protease n=1 Tax=Nocardiopsis sp. N85 TaxID=3029400 RepID=UPI00237F72BC|nr:CPBP family glutamic-type intramembrane protease [Nocardiopsis sp. N85]MDE3721537.1 CPBP family glutamic-type intramembrane protease [Nocardiopsis sp. N85]